MARVKVGGTETKLFAEPAVEDGTKAPPVAGNPDPEREAIQAEARAADREMEIKKLQNDAIEKMLARKESELRERNLDVLATDPRGSVNSTAKNGFVGFMHSSIADEDEPVTATRGEEMYGKPGTFSSYRIGPFTTSSKIRKGETRATAYVRLLDALRQVAAEERKKAHEEWSSHFLANIASKS